MAYQVLRRMPARSLEYGPRAGPNVDMPKSDGVGRCG
jgi:hypothetical protein